MIQFEVPGEPVAKARPRVARGRMYTPATTTAFERAVALAAGAVATTWPPAPTPIRVSIDAVYSRPKSRPKWFPSRLWRLGCRFVKPTRADADNIVKAVFDGAQRADVGGGFAPTGHKGRPGTWVGDDARFQLGEVTRWFAAIGEEARTIVRMEVIPDFGC